MKLFFGLGNPGKKYQKTRHNVGQIFISKLTESSDIKIAISEKHFMNESGFEVQKICHFYKIAPENLYIVHDDLDLPVGEYRLQFDRGPAGHHGVESVIEHLGTRAFWRIRIGIGKPQDQTPVEDYVTKPFSQEELVTINTTIDKIIKDLCQNSKLSPSVS
jgi:peptidyl-tRNA hydrolase, PTH1 family